ncbi:MAG: hypothetical protein WBC06_00040 [Chitinophagaceae bacterium]
MMNKQNSFAVIFFAVIVLLACNEPVKGPNGVVYKSAVQYNDYIVNRQTLLMKNVVAFGEIVQKDLDSAGIMLTSFEEQTDKMISELKGMPSYKKDSSFRDAAIRSFIFYKQVFSNDYKRILEIGKEGTGGTEESGAEIDSIVEKITREEEDFDKAFHNAQKDFADKNKMKLIDNSVQKEINKMNEK